MVDRSLTRPPSRRLRPLHWPHWKLKRRIRLQVRASRLEHALLSTVALVQLIWLWGWGLCCWRLGTLLISTAFLMVVLHWWPEEQR